MMLVFVPAAVSASAPRLSVDSANLSGNRLKVSWKPVEGVSGYQVQCAFDSLFLSAKSITLQGDRASAATFTVSSGQIPKYVRTRTWQTTGQGTVYSDWSFSSNAEKNKKAAIHYRKKKGKKREYRQLSHQKMHGYDTFQGGCSDGTYSYHAMYHRGKEKCRIIKVRNSSGAVVKVSRPLPVAHGNDMTYNKSNHTLVVHYTKHPNRLSVINARTLKKCRHVTVKRPASLPGASRKALKQFKGMTGIAWNQSRKQYVVTLAGSRNMMLLNTKFRPVEYLNIKKSTSYLNQGIECTNDYILRAQSPQKKGQTHNIIAVYDWNGRYRFRIRLSRKDEIEHIYVVKRRLYGGSYRSYTVKKTKRVWRTVRAGKKKSKYRLKRVKVHWQELHRDNHIYRITSF